MKQVKIVIPSRTRQKVLSVILTVATLITALVVIPITLPATEVEASGNSGAFSKGSTSGSGRVRANVFYAKDWIELDNTQSRKGIFYYSSATGSQLRSTGDAKSNTAGANFYHSAGEAFCFRAAADGVTSYDAGDNPWVYFTPWKSGINNIEQNRPNASKYKYITVTYSIFSGAIGDKNPGTDCDYLFDKTLSMRLHILTSENTKADEAYSVAEPLTECQDTYVDGNGTTKFLFSSNVMRYYYTVTFDLTNLALTGELYGFRFDYFDNDTISDYYNDDEKKVMFVDSFGFFETKEEAEFHADERDWARNTAYRQYLNENNGADEEDVNLNEYNGFNIYRAVSQSWEGYVSDSGGTNYREATTMEYDSEERAYKLKLSDASDDPKITFYFNGNETYGKNKVDRSLSNDYRYIAIVYRLPTTYRDVLDHFPEMRVFAFTKDTSEAGTYALDSQNSKQVTLKASKDYQTAVFDLSGKSIDITGFRLDYFNQSNNANDTNKKVSEGYHIYIDSIGFFKTPEEAENFSRAPIKFDASDLKNNEDSNGSHNVTTSTSAYNGYLQVKVTNNCKNEKHDETADLLGDGKDNYCGHLKQYGGNVSVKAGPCAICIDPQLAVAFPNSFGVNIKDYKYILVEYKIPYSSSNLGEKYNYLREVCPDYTCTCSNREKCRNSKKDLYDAYGYIPFSVFPTLDTGDEKSNFMIQQKLYDDDNLYNKDITCMLSIDSVASANTYEFIEGFRIDPFDRHYAIENSFILIKSVRFVCTEEEAKISTDDDELYQIRVTVDDEVSQDSSYGTINPSDTTNDIHGISRSTNALQNQSYSETFKLEADHAYVRDHYDFKGWQAFYVDSEGNRQPLTIENNMLTATLTSDTFTTKTYTASGKQQIFLEVVLVPIWEISTQSLTINSPSSTTDEACIYKITGLTVDNIVCPFPEGGLLVSGVSDNKSNNCVSLLLPDGEYTVQMLTNWGWRYVGHENSLKKSSIMIQANGNMVYNSDGTYSKAANAAPEACDFSAISPRKNSWLNGYGYAAIDVPATASTAES